MLYIDIYVCVQRQHMLMSGCLAGCLVTACNMCSVMMLKALLAQYYTLICINMAGSGTRLVTAE